MQEIQQILIDFYLTDVRIMSNPWMYYPLCIPAFVYVVFMTFKWSVLTMPFWVPLSSVFRGFANGFIAKIDEKIKEKKK